MSVEKAFEINQQSSERKVITEELEDLQKDIVELNQVLSSIKWCSVKEVILSEINLISAKIHSLKELTVIKIISISIDRRYRIMYMSYLRPRRVTRIAAMRLGCILFCLRVSCRSRGYDIYMIRYLLSIEVEIIFIPPHYPCVFSAFKSACGYFISHTFI